MDNQDPRNSTSEQVGESAVKKTGSAIRKGAQAVGWAFSNSIKGLILSILPFIAIILVVMLVIGAIYTVDKEIRGQNTQYSLLYDNPLKVNEEGDYYATLKDANQVNQQIIDFYKYFSGQSVYKLLEDDNETLLMPDSDEFLEINDYYKRENMYLLPPNLLFSLDEQVYRKPWKYPEQFIQPVYYDKETLKTINLTDEDRNVVAESFEQDLETGQPTGETIVSVRDYGLGTILKYNEQDDYKRELYLEGFYTRKDIWDSSAERVRTISIAPDPFKFLLESEPIHLIDKAMTFNGNIEYKYEINSQKFRDLTPGESDIERKTVTEYIYDVKAHTVCETYTVDVVNELGETVEEEREDCDTTYYDLKKYRDTSTSAVMEYLPIVTETVTDTLDQQYYEDYLFNFEAYVPRDVLNEFVLTERIDYESYIFDFESMLTDAYGFDIGTALTSGSFEAAYGYEELVVPIATRFGVDPYLIIAMIAQESSGNPLANADGLMQITDALGTSISATDASGRTVTEKIDHTNLNDPEHNILIGTMFFKSLLDSYNGDVYKAVQAYNFGVGTMDNVRKANPEAWNSDYGWMYFREEGRQETRPYTQSISLDCIAYPNASTYGYYFGDSCYLENVLQYYAGHDLESVETNGESWWDNVLSAGNTFLDWLFEKEESDTVPKFDHVGHTHYETPEYVMRMYRSFDENTYFSEVGYGDLSFFDAGFFEAAGTVGISLDEILEMAPNADGYITPIVMDGTARITSPFGMRIHPISGDLKMHNGIDVAAPTGTRVYAVAAGRVTLASYAGSAGNAVVIDHGNGVVTKYFHLSAFNVKVGDIVNQGSVIGLVGNTGGSTGSHLHFELIINGVYTDPAALIR